MEGSMSQLVQSARTDIARFSQMGTKAKVISAVLASLAGFINLSASYSFFNAIL